MKKIIIPVIALLQFSLSANAALLGDWGGTRSGLEESGYTFNFEHTLEVASAFKEGVRNDVVFLGNLDAQFALDAEKAFGWNGASFFVYYLVDWGKAPSQLVGDVQVTSNIEVENSVSRFFEVWYQQNFMDDKLSFLIGLHDLNSEFYVTDASDMFLNSSFGIGAEFAQAGTNGPSIFPVTSLGFRVAAKPIENTYVRAAVYDAVPGKTGNDTGTHIRLSNDEGALLVTEVGYASESGTKLGVGVWHFTENFNDLAEVDSAGNALKRKNQGLFFVSEYQIMESLNTFARFGFASRHVNAIASNVAAGVTYSGLLPNVFSADSLGLGFTTAFATDKFRRNQSNAGVQTDSSETSIEVTYSMEILDGLTVQPDFQYVVNPSFATATNDAIIGTLRIITAF